jgi:hypothetical protein
VKDDYFERGDGLSCRYIQLSMVEQVIIKHASASESVLAYSYSINQD